MLRELCEQRKLMNIWDAPSQSWQSRRDELLSLICAEEYGVLPKPYESIAFETIEQNHEFCAGKVTLSKILISVKWVDRAFSFPVYSAVPNSNVKHPFFVLINFSDRVPDKYLPTEEICDRGFAVISLYYQDISRDIAAPWRNECSNHDDLFDIVCGDTPEAGGRIALWAWGASRAMDYAQTVGSLDLCRGAVIGHSRLGKTALLAGALDTRFEYVISNDSGCSGAAISRGKSGESVARILERYGYWFCENYKKYAADIDKLPFDQHCLLASIAPRKVYVSSAERDLWADPKSEFLSCFAASEVYEKLGMSGLVCPDRFPQPGESFHAGSIAYHLRHGTHYLSREDWNLFMDYIDNKSETNAV